MRLQACSQSPEIGGMHRAAYLRSKWRQLELFGVGEGGAVKLPRSAGISLTAQRVRKRERGAGLSQSVADLPVEIRASLRPLLRLLDVAFAQRDHAQAALHACDPARMTTPPPEIQTFGHKPARGRGVSLFTCDS